MSNSASNDVALTVGNASISGWTSVRITRGVDRVPSDFDITLTERYPQQNTVVVLEGSACTVSIGGDLVMTGYVDRVSDVLDAHSHTLTISGRGKCEDLVDCTALANSFQFMGLTVADTAVQLAAPFGISVKAQQPGLVIPQTNLNVGETAWSVIDRLCKTAQLLAYEDEEGALVIGPIGTDEAAGGFALGVNIERAAFMRDMSQRYSEYRVYLTGTGIMNDVGDQPFIEYTVQDPLTPRYRPTAFVAETGDMGQQVSNARAQWECNRRIGRGYALNLTVSSWRDSAGTLYKPNTLAALSLPQLKIPAGQKWLIGEVSYHRDMQGTVCEIMLMPPQAFQPEPMIYMPLDWRVGLALGMGGSQADSSGSPPSGGGANGGAP